MTKRKLEAFDLRLISLLRQYHLWIARIALFIVFFWFGILKVLALSPASPLAAALTERTVGLQYFESMFFILSIVECIIGILFLFPKAIRVVLPLLIIHMILVCSPLLLLPDLVWTAPFVPTLEGQYIIKNAVIVALAIAIASATQPLRRTT